jgi:hypothetical protein
MPLFWVICDRSICRPISRHVRHVSDSDPIGARRRNIAIVPAADICSAAKIILLNEFIGE